MNLRKINMKKKEIEYITIEINVGTDISGAAGQAIMHRKIIEQEIQFEFNDIIIKTYRNCTEDDLINQYYSKVKNRIKDKLKQSLTK